MLGPMGHAESMTTVAGRVALCRLSGSPMWRWLSFASRLRWTAASCTVTRKSDLVGRVTRTMPDAPEQPPKIVFLVSDYFPSRGGTTTQTRLHALEFLHRGWNVTVLTRRVRNTRSSEQIEGIRVKRVGVPGRGRMAKGIDLVVSWLWLFWHRRSLNAVSVIMDADFALAARAAGLASSTVLTWVTRGDATRLLGGRFGRIRRLLLGRCKHVVLTPRMRSELEQLGVIDITIIPVPVDTARFHRPTEIERGDGRRALGIADTPTVLFVGHLQERKGVDLLIRAFRLIVDAGHDAELVLVGGPVETADLNYVRLLEQLVLDYQLEESVHFTGGQDDVVPFMFAADVFCLPSHREGMPNVLLEAMACGLPCVAPASAGGDEVLVEAAGIIPSSNSPEDLSDALISILTDREHGEALGVQAAVQVRMKNGPPEIARAYERLW